MKGYGNNNQPGEIRETTHGRRLERLRWQGGRLQMCFSEKYEQYEGRRLLNTGTREIWEDVPGPAPSPEAGLLDLVYRIRVAAGDPEGRLMQDELVEKVRQAIAGA